MTEFHDIDPRIAHFLQGSMSLEERLGFEREMQNDPSLREQVEQERLVQEVLLDASLLQTKQDWKNFDFQKGEFRSEKPRQLPGLGIMTLVLLTGVAIYLGVDKSVDSRPSKELFWQDTRDVVSQAERPSNIQNPPAGPKVEQKTWDTPPQKELPPALVDENHGEEPQVGTTLPELFPVEVSASTDTTVRQEPVAEPHTREEVPEPETEGSKPLDCSAISWDVKWESAPSCDEEATGSIRVGEIVGGVPPFEFALDDPFFHQASPVFSELSSGIYEVFLFDAQGCSTSVKDIEISGKRCPRPLKETSFSLSLDREWPVPLNQFVQGEITFYSVTGVEIRTLEITGTNDTWDGRSSNGDFVRPGNYPFIIRLEDGTLMKSAVTVRP